MADRRRINPFRQQLSKLEPLAPLALGLHGFLMLGYMGEIWQWLLVGLVVLLGVMGLSGWRGKQIITSVRAAAILLIAWLLMLTTGGTRSFFLMWYFLLVAVYPLLLTPRAGVVLPVIAVGGYLSLLPFSDGSIPLVVLLARAFLLLFIGLMVHAIGRATIWYAGRYQHMREISRSSEFLASLSSVAAYLQTSLKPEQVFEILRDELSKMGLLYQIALLEPESQDLVVQYTSLMPKVVTKAEKLTEMNIKGLKLPREHSPLYDMISRRTRVSFVRDVKGVAEKLFPQVPGSVKATALRLVGITPETRGIDVLLMVEERILGVLSVWGQELSEDDLSAMSIFATQVSSTLEVARLYEGQQEKVERLARDNALVTALGRVASQLDLTSDSMLIIETMGLELRDLGINCLVGQFDPDDQSLVVTYTNLESKTLAVAEKLTKSSADGFRVSQSMLPVYEQLVDHQSPVISPGPKEMLSSLLPDISERVSDQIVRLVGRDSDSIAIYLPLINKGNVTGTLIVWGEKIIEDDIDSLALFASQVASALEFARLHDQVRAQRVEEQAFLLRNSHELLAENEAQAILDHTIAAAVEYFKPDLCYILLLEDGENQLRLVAGYGWENGLVGQTMVPAVADSQPGFALKSKYPVVIEDFSQEQHFRQPQLLRDHAIKASICVPMVAGERSVGVLGVHWRGTRQFSEDEARLLALIANQIAQALERTRLYSEAQRRAQELQSLYSLAVELEKHLDIGGVAGSVTAAIAENFSASMVLLAHFDPQDAQVQGVAPAFGITDEQAEAFGYPVTEHIVDFWNISSQSSLYIGDIHQVPDSIRRLILPFEVNCVIGTRVWEHGQSFGMVFAGHPEVGYFSTDDTQRLEAYGQLTALAMGRVRLFEAERERQEELRDINARITALGHVAARIQNSNNLSDIFETMADKLRELDLNYVIALFEPGDGSLRIRFHSIESTVLALIEKLIQRTVEDFPLMPETFPPYVELVEHQRALWKDASETMAYVMSALPYFPKQIVERVIRLVGIDVDSPSIYLPLTIEDQGLGVMWFWGQGLVEDDVAIFAAFAAQVAIAIENTRLFEAEHLAFQRAETLRQAGAVVAATLDPDKAVQRILEQLALVVPCDSASVQILGQDEGDQYLEIIGGLGWEEEEIVKGLRFPIPGDNPNTLVVEGRCTHIIHNIAEEYPTFNDGPHYHIQSWMGVPLIAQEKLIGMLALDSSQPHRYRQDHAETVAAFADQVAIALENSRLFENTQRQLEELSLLNEVAAAITEASDEDELLNNVVQIVGSAFFSDHFGVLLLNEEVDGLQEHSSYHSVPVDATLNIIIPLGQGISGQVAVSGQPRLVRDVDQESNYIRPQNDSMRSELCVPLKIGERVIGVINAESRQVDNFTEADQSLLITVAGQLATAIERLRSEQIVRQSEGRYRSLFEGVPVGLYRSTTQGEFLDANQFFIDMLAYPDQDTFMATKAADMYYNPDDRQRWQELISNNGLVRDFEVQLRCYNGEIIWVLLNARAEFDDDGEVLFYEGSARDITYRKQAEAEIQSLAKFPEENPNPVLRVSGDGSIFYANEAGLPVLETCGCKLGDPLPEKMNALALDAFESGETKVSDIEVGDQVFLFTLAPIKVSGYVNMYGRDITELRKAEDGLRQSEEHFRSLLETAPNAIIVVDESGEIQRVNSMVNVILGYQPEELIGQPIEALLPEALREQHRDHRAGYHVNPQTRPMGTAMELTALRKDGNSIPVEVSLGPMQSESGLLVTAILRDVSDRKEIEQEQRKLSSTVEQTADGVMITNPNGVIQYVNPAFESMTGYSKDELLDHTPKVVKSGEHKKRKYEELWSTIMAGEAYRGTFINRKKNGELFHVDQTITPLFDQGGVVTSFVSTWKDITERVQAEGELRRRAAYLQALHAIDVAITGSLDLKVTLNVLIDQAMATLHVDAAGILLLSDHTQTLEQAVRRGFRTDVFKYTHLRLGEGFAGKAAFERRLILLSNLDEASAEFPEATIENLAKESFVTYVGAPLIAKEQLKGVLEIFHRSPLDSDPQWLEFLETMASQAAIAIDNASLFDDLQRSNLELTLAYDTTLEGWAKALELRDEETEGHTRRVTEMTLELAQMMGINGDEIEHIRRGALLHDIGKMGIPDSILLKPGKLTEVEWEIMRQHPVYAHDFISQIDYLHPAMDIPYCHHEKWDGSGYPRGLRGESIPLSARIFAVIDVWDALSSDRPYRKAWEQDRVKAHIIEGAGSHFDPAVVEIFLQMIS